MEPNHALVPLIVYMAPSFIAAFRDCRSFRAIFFTNMLLGWTLIGWFAALIWAITGEDR